MARDMAAEEAWECRSGLIAFHNIAGAVRLLWLFPMLAADLRVRWQFSCAPDIFGRGVPELLRARDLPQLPWEEVMARRFDVVLAAGGDNLAEMRDPVILLPHGAGVNKLGARRAGRGLPVARSVYRLSRDYLIKGGRLIPSVLALSHEDQLEILTEQCPDARKIAEIVGDPVPDQIVRHAPLRDRYRDALGLSDGRKLVVVSSTWTSRCLLVNKPDLLERIMEELPNDEYQVVLVLHPNFWSHYSRAYLKATFRSQILRGLRLVEPDQDWLVLLLAADWVIGDHGSVTQYAAAAGVPVLIGAHAEQDATPYALSTLLARTAPPLLEDVPVPDQLARAAADYTLDCHRAVVDRLTSVPGEFASRIRRVIYRQLGLDELPFPAALPELVVPQLVDL